LLIVDRMLVGGIRFVLGKIAAAVDAELNDDSRLREELLAAQMRLELGELSKEEFARFEAEVLGRLRDIRERQLGEAALPMKAGELKSVEVTASFEKK
jgi:hypothetical protein